MNCGLHVKQLIADNPLIPLSNNIKKKIIMLRIPQLFIALALTATTAAAQNKPKETVTLAEDKDAVLMVGKKDSTTKNSPYIGIGTGGVKISTKRQDSINKRKDRTNALADVGPGYQCASRQDQLCRPCCTAIPAGTRRQKEQQSVLLRQGKSINVNIWPVLMNIKLLQRKSQKISLYTGAGLQLYNFKFNKDISFINETTPKVIEDNVQFSKNKLAFAYASIPLMVNFKTRMGGSNLWLTYGFGAIGGYCFDSWTKQISDERGKQKNHDEFNFQKFNLNLSGEIGIDNYIRFYATYQVTNMFKDALTQNPYCIGIRFFGI